MKVIMITIALLLAWVPLQADLADELRCREIGFSQSVETRDVNAFRSFIDADARFVGASVQRGVESVVTAWGVFFSSDGPRIKWRPQFVEVLEDGTLALSRGPYRLSITSEDGKVLQRWGTFNSVWRKQPNGEWKIVFDAGNEAGEAPAADVQALLEQDDDC